MRYYIIPIWNWSNLLWAQVFLLESKLHYSYMELEPCACSSVLKYTVYYIIPIWNWSYSYCHWVPPYEYLYYIIPIWNWSLVLVPLFWNIQCITLFLYGIGAIVTAIEYPLMNIYITLFLYGIGAYNKATLLNLKQKDYIIPIWNWSLLPAHLFYLLLIHYIIPIWNWSPYSIKYCVQLINNYIIPIWNWSLNVPLIYLRNYQITLFLYGIGAIFTPNKF